MSRFTATIALAFLLAFASSIADAKPQRQKQARQDSQATVQCVYDNSGRMTCPGGGEGIQRRASRAGKANRSASVGRSCLTSDTLSVLTRAEAHFGVTFTLVSTCRPGATFVSRGAIHASEHSRNRAVDLLVPRGISKQSVVRWLYANAKGVTMTYRNMPHVHFDTGPYHKLACGGCGRNARHAKMAHAR